MRSASGSSGEVGKLSSASRVASMQPSASTTVQLGLIGRTRRTPSATSSMAVTLWPSGAAPSRGTDGTTRARHMGVGGRGRAAAWESRSAGEPPEASPCAARTAAMSRVRLLYLSGEKTPETKDCDLHSVRRVFRICREGCRVRGAEVREPPLPARCFSAAFRPRVWSASSPPPMGSEDVVVGGPHADLELHGVRRPIRAGPRAAGGSAGCAGCRAVASGSRAPSAGHCARSASRSRGHQPPQ
jgi:hypothetical protein